MFELVVLMTYLARAWSLLNEFSVIGAAIPVSVEKEFRGLKEDLNALFLDPSHILNPVVVQVAQMEAEGRTEDEGQTAEDVSQPPPVAAPCPACKGAGVVRSRFLGVPPKSCTICGGTGEIVEREMAEAPAQA